MTKNGLNGDIWPAALKMQDAFQCFSDFWSEVRERGIPVATYTFSIPDWTPTAQRVVRQGALGHRPAEGDDRGAMAELVGTAPTHKSLDFSADRLTTLGRVYDKLQHTSASGAVDYAALSGAFGDACHMRGAYAEQAAHARRAPRRGPSPAGSPRRRR